MSIRSVVRLGLFLLLCGNVVSLFASDRFVAQFQDGTRVEDAEIRAWHDAEAEPTMAGRRVFDAENPARWIIDRQHPPADPQEAYVELIGGDRLAGMVVGFKTGEDNPNDRHPAHLVVQPVAAFHHPEEKGPTVVRIGLDWVQRIVWQRASGEEFRPNTAVFRDESSLSFRSLRWDSERLRVLTDQGIQEVAWKNLAGLHMAQGDPWDSYFNQLAVLNPKCTARMIQIETSDGSRWMTSTERFQAHNRGDVNRPETWFQRIQPVWSLDPCWIRYRTISCWRFFAPEFVPLTTIAPKRVERESIFGSGLRWRNQRNVLREQLQSSSFLFGDGMGVQATTELHFTYPQFAKAIRTQASLDRLAGEGGCVTLSVLDDSHKPLFEFLHLQGAEKVIDTGWLALPTSEKEDREVILRADMDHTQRPAKADPFDLRDAVNWYEPTIHLDLPALQAEVARRVSP